MKLANGNHIVMVDDNEGDTYLARTCFERSILKNPWLAFSRGIDFLKHLVTVKEGQMPMPAFVLLDLNMPDMSGLEVLEQTRRDEFFLKLPIICMLTSSTSPCDRQRVATFGGTGFLTKPHRIDEYVAFFNSLL